MSVSRSHMTPELPLYLLTPSCRLYTAKEEPDLGDPWWAIFWPGGQVLARFILDQPATVAKKKVLDLGSGCGAVSIAAKRSGASRVVANDIDPNCRLALDINAEMCKQSLEGVEMLEADLLNGDTDIRREVLSSTDVLLVGDMFYDEHIGSEVFDLCNTFKGLKRENEVYVGDPGRWALEEHSHFHSSFLCCAKYTLGETTRDENNGFSHGLVWRFSNIS